MIVFDAMKSRACAVELLTSAFCNMNCKYCYMPKVEEMKQIHKEVIEYLKTDKFIEDLKNVYGDNLEYINLWGTEPTLILDHFTPKLKLYFKTFKKLEGFGFSSNFLTNVESIFRFLKELERVSEPYVKERNKKIKVSIQISLDGPDFITDNSRQAGATKKIVENYKKYLQFLEENKFKNIKIQSNFKPTLSMDHITMFNKDVAYFDKYFKFFDDLYEEYYQRKELFESDYFNMGLATSGTLVVPGTYTSQDGKEWALYLKNLSNFRHHLINHPKYKHYNFFASEYDIRLSRLITYINEAYAKPEMMTCSGGDSNWALDNKKQLHICHRSFFFDDNRYMDAVMKNKEFIDNWDVSLFENNKIQHVKKNYMVDSQDKFEMARFMYLMRGYHEYTEFKESFVYAALLCLAKAGQASKIYLENDKLALLLSKFLTQTFGCSIENALNTTSVHLTPMSLIRLWANGAFEQLLKDYFEVTFKYKGGN